MKILWFLLTFLPLQAYANFPVVNFAPQKKIYYEGQSVTVVLELSAPTELGVSTRLYIDSSSTGSFDDTNIKTLQIPVIVSPGETRGIVTFTILQDEFVENSETLILKIAAPINATLGSESTLELEIRDAVSDETLKPKVSFLTTTTAAEEGQVVEVKAVLSSPSDSLVVVPLEVCGTAEYPSDHDLIKKEIYFNPGSIESVLSISILEDLVVEEIEEDIIIKMIAPVTNAEIGSNSEHVITIQDSQL